MSALVPYEEAVVDLAICGPRSDWDGSGEPGLPPVAADDVVLIEINPFDKFTDAGLFRWGGKGQFAVGDAGNICGCRQQMELLRYGRLA